MSQAQPERSDSVAPSGYVSTTDANMVAALFHVIGFLDGLAVKWPERSEVIRAKAEALRKVVA